MKNPFEGKSRVEAFKKTKTNLGKHEKEKESLQAPFGHLDHTDHLLANMAHETMNFVASIPNIPRIKLLEMRIKFAERKLEEIINKDRDEAFELWRKYDILVREAAKSGDDTKMKKCIIDYQPKITHETQKKKEDDPEKIQKRKEKQKININVTEQN